VSTRWIPRGEKYDLVETLTKTRQLAFLQRIRMCLFLVWNCCFSRGRERLDRHDGSPGRIHNRNQDCKTEEKSVQYCNQAVWHVTSQL
jgi:hypothetical protein